MMCEAPKMICFKRDSVLSISEISIQNIQLELTACNTTKDIISLIPGWLGLINQIDILLLFWSYNIILIVLSWIFSYATCKKSRYTTELNQKLSDK